MGREDGEVFENVAGSFRPRLGCRFSPNSLSLEEPLCLTPACGGCSNDVSSAHRFTSTETAPWLCPAATTDFGENQLLHSLIFLFFFSVLTLHVLLPRRGVSLAELCSASLEAKASYTLGDFSRPLKVQCHLAQPDPKFSLRMYSPRMWVWSRIHSRCSLQDENYPRQSQPCVSCGRALRDSRQVAALPISHPPIGSLSVHLHAEAALFTQLLALWPQQI